MGDISTHGKAYIGKKAVLGFCIPWRYLTEPTQTATLKGRPEGPADDWRAPAAGPERSQV